MRKYILFILISLLYSNSVKASEFFTPVKDNALRLPSVPIVVVDPYFSIWSKYDQLYAGKTEHWSGAKKPLTGVLRVDGNLYRFMGMSYDILLPNAAEGGWDGQYTFNQPSGAWYGVDYDDSAWSTGAAAFGGNDDGYKNIGTEWGSNGSNIWVRRTFTLDEISTDGYYSVIYKHDDTFELYLNGHKIADTGYTWDVSGTSVKVDASLLRQGENVLAAHCYNTMGGAYVDFGLYFSSLDEAVQTDCVVMPTSTYYTFRCGAVDLDLVFTAPQVMSDLDIFTTPINYISYQVRSNDGKEHEVQLYLDATTDHTVRNTGQGTSTRRIVGTNLTYLRTGNIQQSVMNHGGDVIDWGYLYLAKDTCQRKRFGLDMQPVLMEEFVKSGSLPVHKTAYTSPAGKYPALAYVDSLGTVGTDGVSDFTMIGYDDTYSIEYHGVKRKGYWAHNGTESIQKRFEFLYANYDSIMNLCRQQDLQIYEDAYVVGGVKYAEICSSVYRQANAAHKLITDRNGNLMYMSKENTSGGFINTLDVTYPSSSLYLIYNPALIKAMLTPIYEHSYLGKWNKNFANHDMGGYPKANGQTYGGDMPVEENGNILILTAIIARLDGDLEYVQRYWDIMTKWADYLVENGKDPAHQLCTDDFMGQSSRNTNLAVKAIMGVASYSELARMLGKTDVADEYWAKAEEMTRFWQTNALSTTGGTHYLLNFGADASTWSTKYNLIWDKIWSWNLFRVVRTRELSFYKTKMTVYGLPLDNRFYNCKNDWHLWVAAMTDTRTEMNRYINPMWKFINECPTRVPVTDCHSCSNASRTLFHARSVVGGYWMPVFTTKFLAGEITSIGVLSPSKQGDVNVIQTDYYDLMGRKVYEPQSGFIYVKKETLNDNSVKSTKVQLK